MIDFKERLNELTKKISETEDLLCSTCHFAEAEILGVQWKQHPTSRRWMIFCDDKPIHELPLAQRLKQINCLPHLIEECDRAMQELLSEHEGAPK